ncbi:hypothetical protein [Roseicyclus mahoneyensis]|jgi:protein-S-isoprenylcysteine O-methyltransferase Ste14|uniref:Uncharacterized protein n=1 Tax=Roseicyclus mahoneyensis TaxID=164332 RepID=A0A316GK69_9RHOB|nr:hypothetical protein [Roseicyclus mahoneyensis]PWK60378.1 hypothetical protein C7455_10414 [Roseicyclus mahoneyensis]
MARAAPCKTCQRLRLYLTVALPLVAMIYLQPDGAVRLATWLPSPTVIGWGIIVVGVVGFALKLRAWRRGGDT